MHALRCEVIIVVGNYASFQVSVLGFVLVSSVPVEVEWNGYESLPCSAILLHLSFELSEWLLIIPFITFLDMASGFCKELW